MGSAGGKMDEGICARARALGEQIAKRDCIIITGACPGLPHEAVKGAKANGGLVVGISPALSLDEHITRYSSPHEEYDVLIFTGDGLMGREVESIRSCDIGAVVGGRSGTLGEFAIAYDEGKLIAVLEQTNGIADHIHEIVRMINKDTGAEVIYDADPERLVARALEVHAERVKAGIAYTFPILDG
ncbi:MAG: hypothetical protein ACE5JM_17415 [Armatimonadota bacterium]